MSIKDNEIDSFGATLDDYIEVENISAGILRGNLGIDENGATIKDTTALAGAALHWIAISDEKLGIDIGEKRGITDGKTVLLRSSKLAKGPIAWEYCGDSVAMAHSAFRAATGQEHNDGPLVLVDVPTMERILENSLKAKYGQAWRGMLGYEQDKLDVFGIVQAKEILDTKNTSLEVYNGTWHGSVSNALGALLRAKCPPVGTYNIQPTTLFDEDYLKGPLVLNIIRQVAEYINQMGKPDVGRDDDNFKEKTRYLDCLLKNENASNVDRNIGINIASGTLFVNVDSLLSYYNGCENEPGRRNETSPASNTTRKLKR